MRTLTAMFDSRADADTARHRLVAAGIRVENVTIHDQTSLDESTGGVASTPISARSEAA